MENSLGDCASDNRKTRMVSVQSGRRWIAEVACEMLQKQDTYEGAQICLCVVAVAGSSADETEKIHLYLMFSAPGCHAGNVQFVAGGNRPSGVLQMERRYLCFY